MRCAGMIVQQRGEIIRNASFLQNCLPASAKKSNWRGDSDAPPGLWFVKAAFPRISLRFILGYYRWPLRGQRIVLAIKESVPAIDFCKRLRLSAFRASCNIALRRVSKKQIGATCKIRWRVHEASGHDFSRAASCVKKMLGFSPCVSLLSSICNSAAARKKQNCM